VIKGNGEEIRRLTEHRSVPFVGEEANGYWSLSRAAISPDGGFVVTDSNFGTQNAQRVALIYTGYGRPRVASAGLVNSASGSLPSPRALTLRSSDRVLPRTTVPRPLPNFRFLTCCAERPSASTANPRACTTRPLADKRRPGQYVSRWTAAATSGESGRRPLSAVRCLGGLDPARGPGHLHVLPPGRRAAAPSCPTRIGRSMAPFRLTSEPVPAPRRVCPRLGERTRSHDGLRRRWNGGPL